MTSNRILISLLAGCILSLAGCSKEENDSNKSKNEEADKILLTSTVSKTRSLNQNIQASQLSSGNTVGVFVCDESGAVIADDIKITADGDGGFSYDRDLYWPVEGKAGIYAYAPYDATFEEQFNKEENSFNVAADQSTDTGYLASDLLYGTPVNGNPIAQTSETVALSFQHKLAKINFNIVNHSETNLGGATVNLQNVANTTTINLKTGELGKSSGTSTIKVANFATDASNYKCSAIIIPQKLLKGSEYVAIKLSDGGILAAKLHSDMELISGKTYNFTITVGVGGADMTAATSLADWDDDTVNLIGDIDPDDIREAEEERLYATFGTPGSNASYTEPTYSWTAGNSNLMTLFTFSGGELKNYKKLSLTISNMTEGASVRVGVYVGKDFTEIGNGFYSNGTKDIDLTSLGIDLSTVTSIAFGGKSGAGGSVDIKASEVYLAGSGSNSGGNSSGNKLTATFSTPGSNATYNAPTYTWTAGNNNLMTCFEFANGELKNYNKLIFTISNLSEGASVRMGYYVDSEWTEFGNGFYSAGAKEVDLTSLGIDLSKITKISFGGKSGSGGSVDILATDVYLEGTGGGSDSGDNTGGGSSDSNSLTATFGTPGSNASYSVPTYAWTAGNSNLMTCFTFANGELKSYKTLTFTISNLAEGASVRMGYYVDKEFKEFGNGFYSNGKKDVDLTGLEIDLSTVTSIAFGGRSGSGSVDIKASDVILSK